MLPRYLFPNLESRSLPRLVLFPFVLVYRKPLCRRVSLLRSSTRTFLCLQVGRSSASRSRVQYSRTRACCCWTKQRALSTQKANASFKRHWTASCRAALASSLLIACPRYALAFRSVKFAPLGALALPLPPRATFAPSGYLCPLAARYNGDLLGLMKYSLSMSALLNLEPLGLGTSSLPGDAVPPASHRAACCCAATRSFLPGLERELDRLRLACFSKSLPTCAAMRPARCAIPLLEASLFEQVRCGECSVAEGSVVIASVQQLFSEAQRYYTWAGGVPRWLQHSAHGVCMRCAGTERTQDCCRAARGSPGAGHAR